jgi:hypothetical protein
MPKLTWDHAEKSSTAKVVGMYILVVCNPDDTWRWWATTKGVAATREDAIKAAEEDLAYSAQKLSEILSPPVPVALGPRNEREHEFICQRQRTNSDTWATPYKVFADSAVKAAERYADHLDLDERTLDIRVETPDGSINIVRVMRSFRTVTNILYPKQRKQNSNGGNA